jgi:hypothetical protein
MYTTLYCSHNLPSRPNPSETPSLHISRSKNRFSSFGSGFSSSGSDFSSQQLRQCLGRFSMISPRRSQLPLFRGFNFPFATANSFLPIIQHRLHALGRALAFWAMLRDVSRISGTEPNGTLSRSRLQSTSGSTSRLSLGFHVCCVSISLLIFGSFTRLPFQSISHLHRLDSVLQPVAM